jgi:hypothetical protein
MALNAVIEATPRAECHLRDRLVVCTIYILNKLECKYKQTGRFSRLLCIFCCCIIVTPTIIIESKALWKSKENYKGVSFLARHTSALAQGRGTT